MAVVNSSVPMVRKTDLAQGRGVVQASHGAEDRGEHQRDHDHLQQLHVAIADQVEPADGGLEHRVAVAIDAVQGDTEDHPQDQGEQHFFRQAEGRATGLGQAQQQGEEHQQVENQRQIH